MAYFDTSWYVHAGDGSTTGYYAVPKWSAAATIPVGTLRRQLAAPAVNSERVFVCIVNGVTGASEPTWVITRGAKTTDNSATWMECTGQTGVNGDVTNTPNWTSASLGSKAMSLGVIIANTAQTYLFICTTAGTNSAGEPPWILSAGSATTAGGATYMCLGVVSTFAFFAAPHARLNNATAVNWGVVGNDFYIADNSAEIGSVALAITLGSAASPCRYFSVDHTSPTTVKAGATITSTLAAASAITVGNGSALSMYFYGISFIASGASGTQILVIANGSGIQIKCEACSFRITGSVSGASTLVGVSSGLVELINCTFGFSNVGQFMTWGGCLLNWRNTSDPCFTGTVPSTILRGLAASGATLLFEGVDLTSAGSNQLFLTQGSGQFTLKNCKLGTGTVIGAPSGTYMAFNVDLVNCDSGAAIYRNERHNAFGDLTTSSTIYRTGGATDGTTPVSHTIVSSSFARQARPFTCLPLVIWNDIVGTARTVTLYGAMYFAGPLPYNDQFWFDVEYMGSASSPIALIVSNGQATSLTPHAVVAVADGSTWNGAGLFTAFTLSATFTALQKGYITIYPKVGTSQTMVIDPKPVLS